MANIHFPGADNKPLCKAFAANLNIPEFDEAHGWHNPPRNTPSTAACPEPPEPAPRPYGSTPSALPISAPTSRVRPYQTRRKRYDLRTLHRSIIEDIHESVALCGTGRVPVPEADPDLPSPPVNLVVIEDQGTKARHAGFVGLTCCDSPWACPVCAPRVTAERQAVIEPQIEAFVGRGYRATKMDLTLSHGRYSDLGDMLKALSEAWSEARSGRDWNDLRKRGDIQFVLGRDITWTRTGGWHPHLHVVILTHPDHGDGSAVCGYLKRAFLRELADCGFDADENRQVVEPCYTPAAATSYAIRSAFVSDRESLASKDRPAGSLTPFEVLQNAIQERFELGGEGFDFWQLLWRDYARGTKGQRQVTTSRGLSLKPVEVKQSPSPVARLTGSAMHELDAAHAVPNLLELAEQVSAHLLPDCLVDYFLRALPSGGWQVSGQEWRSVDPDLWNALSQIYDDVPPATRWKLPARPERDDKPDPEEDQKKLIKAACDRIRALGEGAGAIANIHGILEQEKFAALTPSDVIRGMVAEGREAECLTAPYSTGVPYSTAPPSCRGMPAWQAGDDAFEIPFGVGSL